VALAGNWWISDYMTTDILGQLTLCIPSWAWLSHPVQASYE